MANSALLSAPQQCLLFQMGYDLSPFRIGQHQETICRLCNRIGPRRFQELGIEAFRSWYSPSRRSLPVQNRLILPRRILYLWSSKICSLV